MKKTNTKRALGMSLISLLACGVMFAGSTYAWFTDSISVDGNRIETGTLKVDLEVLTESGFQSLRENNTPVFSQEARWEPGYTDYSVLKIQNEGDLAVKWNLKAIKVGADSKKLAEVIDVYAKVSEEALEAPKSLNEAGYEYIGTLAEVLAKGTLLEGEFDPNVVGQSQEKYLGIMLHMQESAGNEYQGITDVQFDIKLNAYQLTAEKDGFGSPYYDNIWTGKVDTSWYVAGESQYVINTAEELAGFASIVNGENGLADTFAGKTVKLDANIDLNGINWTAIGCPMEDGYVGFEGTFDGQGHTISNLNIDNKANWGQGLFGYITSKNTVIKNLNIENVSINTEDTSGAVAGYATFGTFENINVTGDVNITGAQHMGGIVGNGYFANFSDCSVIANEGSKITASTSSFVGGIVGYHGAGNVVIEDCDVKNLELTGYGAIGAITGLVSTNNTITGCTAENIILNKTSIETNPSVGLAAGSWDVSETGNAVVSNNTFKNITLNGKYVPSAGEVKELFGSNYSNKPITGVITNENNSFENITNNLEKLVTTIKVNNKAELLTALAGLTGEAIIEGVGDVTVNSEAYNEIVIPAGTTIKNIDFTFNTNCNVIGVMSSYADTVTFEDCTFASSQVNIGNDNSAEQSNYVFNNCELNGSVYSCVGLNANTTVDYNDCEFGLFTDGWAKGFVVCMGGTQTFIACTFDYAGGSTMGSNQYTKWNAVNAYADGPYTSNVILSGCNSVATQRFTYGSGKASITVK